MARRKRGQDVHGVLLLDKPPGLSSNQALQAVRRLLDARKAGHTGNLDPFATGMLPLCFGEATKTAGFMLDADKCYRATARLGQETDSGDVDGALTRSCPVPKLREDQVHTLLAGFRGDIEQVPPMYSALKHQGRPLYELARQGQVVERAPRQVTIHAIDLLAWSPPMLEFQVRCSKGTYVRTLAEDIAGRMESCAHLTALRRISVGQFGAGDMLSLETVEQLAEQGALERRLLPVDAGLAHWPVAELTQQAEARFRHGNPVESTAAPKQTGPARVHGPGGRPLGLANWGTDGRVRPLRVFNFQTN